MTYKEWNGGLAVSMRMMILFPLAVVCCQKFRLEMQRPYRAILKKNLQSHETAIPEEDEYLHDLTLSKGRFQIPFDFSRDGPERFT